MLTRTILAITLAGFALTGSAQADTYRHIDNLALQLEKYAKLLDHEFTTHYRHTSEYRHLHEDSIEMVRLARHVHDVAHDHGSYAHLKSDLRQLDRLFHHIEDLVDEIEHDADHFDDHHGHFYYRRGGYHGRYGGHVHGDTRHVRRILEAMEDTLHHLQDDVEELAAIEEHYDHRPSPIYSGNRGPIIRFSRPGFSFWWGR